MQMQTRNKSRANHERLINGQAFSNNSYHMSINRSPPNHFKNTSSFKSKSSKRESSAIKSLCKDHPRTTVDNKARRPK